MPRFGRGQHLAVACTFSPKVPGMFNNMPVLIEGNGAVLFTWLARNNDHEHPGRRLMVTPGLNAYQNHVNPPIMPHQIWVLELKFQLNGNESMD